VKIQVQVFGLVTPCGVTVRHQRFGESRCSYLQSEMKKEAARSSDTSISYRNKTWRHKTEYFKYNENYYVQFFSTLSHS